MPQDREKCRILVVDDDDDIRHLVAFLLTETGFEVVVAANGVEALEVLGRQTRPPHLVLLDRHMPVMNGDDLAAALHTSYPSIRIVAFTSSPGGKAWAARLNAAGHILKPFLVDELIDTVDQLCPLRRPAGPREAAT